MKHVLKFTLAGIVFAITTILYSTVAMADGKATVAVDSAYIRSSAGTSGTIVASVMKNDVLEVIESTTDSAGNTWYKVYVDATSTGYIRADLVTTSGSVTQAPATSNETSASTSESNSDAGSSTPVTPVVTPVDPTPIVNPDFVEVVTITGKTTGDVRVRKGPSTETAVIDNVNAGIEVTIKGYEDCSDGKWYLLSYGEKTGYIRSDFVSLNGELEIPNASTETPETPENDPAPEEPDPEPSIYYDYEVVFELDGNGDTVWYLNDYIEGTKNPISELIGAKKELETTKTTYEKALKKKKIGNIVLTVFVILLIGGGVAAFIMFRRWYYGYDETEEPVAVKKDTGRNTPHYSTKTASANSSNEFRMETIGAKKSQPAANTQTPVGKSVNGGVLLPDGHIQMPDGTVKKAVVGVRQPDGSIKLSDGRVKMPDGTIVYPESSHVASSSYEVKEVQTASKAKARNFVSEDDDMEFGFLNIDSGLDED